MGAMKPGLHRRSFLRHLAGAALALCAATALAQARDLDQVIAPTGKLRVGLYPGTPTSILPATSGEPRGVGYELGRALAKKLGVPFDPVVLPNNAEVFEAAKKADVDFVFTNATAVRAREIDFGPPAIEIELGYLVAPGVTVKAVDEIDRAGLRIGVAAGSSSERTLSQTLKQASLVAAPSVVVAGQMLADGRLDAFATNKATLFEMAQKVPGARVLDGQWGLEHMAIGIPKGREAALPVVRAFTADAISDGTVAAAMDRAGLRGARVAPAQR